MRKILLISLLLTLPAFSRMLMHGVYTMHDPHLFRQYEYDMCLRAGNFPCRWAPDSGKGYGEPLFNFYTQAPYMFTSVFRLLGFQIIDSVKIMFIVSLVLSAVAMFWVASSYWGLWGGLLSAAVYTYAPYRAVDVWVRGALPESLAFVLYPLLFYWLDRFIDSGLRRYLWALSLGLAVLITTHNLSFLMFVPFLGIWWIYKAFVRRTVSSMLPLSLSGLFALLLSAYYLLPVIFESRLVTVTDTVSGYYDFRAHFITLRQIFLSRYWGYGASLWGTDDRLNVSVGHFQWIIPVLAIILLVFFRRRVIGNIVPAAAMLLLGFLGLFMTHGRSAPLWEAVKPLAYVQFPWRYLAPAVFFLSLCAGSISSVFRRKIVLLVLVPAVILASAPFFRPDIWRPISDTDQFSGKLWEEGMSSSLSDFWPRSASRLPAVFAPDQPEFITGFGDTRSWYKAGHSARYIMETATDISIIRFPIVYFPGWSAKVNGQPWPLSPSGELAQISLNLSAGRHDVVFNFLDTPPRKAGNLISLVAVLAGTYLWQKDKLSSRY